MSRTSIIIPAYNQADFLAQAVESALHQNQATTEVIVVDDGSTDHTPEIVAHYQNHPGFHALRQPNAGLPSARNRGAREATGDYLCFLDSDDWLHPDKSNRQSTLLDADANLGFAYCDIVTVDTVGNPLPEQHSVAQPGRVLSGDIFPSLMLGGYFPPHTVLVRRQAFEEAGGFDPDLGGHADYDLWLRLAARHQAVFVPDHLAFYRTHPNSMSKDGLHMAESRLATLRKISRLHPNLAGDALHALQQRHLELNQANLWLQNNWNDLLARLQTNTNTHVPGQEQFALLQHLASARLLRGRPEQLQVWDATLDGGTSKAVLLDAPAELTFNLPTGERGQFHTAICIHPDAWSKPDAGGCEFLIKVDQRLALAMAIDPHHLPEDRHWHEICLHLPTRPSGPHQVSLETKPVGSGSSFRWALWRNPRFVWQPQTSSPSIPSPSSTSQPLVTA